MIRLQKIYSDQQSLDRIADWRNKSLSTLRTAGLTSKGISQINWVKNLDESEKYYFIFKGSVVVGYCGLDKIHPANRTAEISLLISPDYRGENIGSTAVKKLIKKGFLKFNLNLIFGEAYSTTQNIKFWYKQGFRPDGVLRQRKYWEGKFYDSMVFSMLKKEMEW